jgi:hypothetical protein
MSLLEQSDGRISGIKGLFQGCLLIRGFARTSDLLIF